MRSSTSTSTRGTTLVEVLITVTIVSVGLTAALGAMRTCIRAQSLAEQRSIVQSLAEEQLAQLRLRGPAQLETEMEGSFAEPYDDYRWSAHVEPKDELIPYRVLQLIISAKIGDKYENEVTIRTML